MEPCGDVDDDDESFLDDDEVVARAAIIVIGTAQLVDVEEPLPFEFGGC